MGIHPDWVWHCNQVNELWVSWKTHAEMFKEAGVTCPIQVIPQCMDMDFKPYRSFMIPNFEGFLFYSIFQWTERKNPKKLLQTYWRTFEGKDDVALLLKVYRSNFSDREQEAIRQDIYQWKREQYQSHYPKVFLYLGSLTHEEIMRLHATGDCFISLHRGEGWGMPQMEAMASGKPIISTNFGGIHEWLDNQHGWLIPYNLTSLFGMGHIPWYTSQQQWADPDYQKAGEAMLEAYSNRQLTQQKGQEAQKFVHSKFNLQAIGRIMKKRLETIHI